MLLLFQICIVLLGLGAAQGGLLYHKGAGASYNLGTFGGHLPHAVKVIRVTNTVAVPIPVPVPYPKHVPVPVSVPKPFPYPVPQPIPVEVTKPVVIHHPVTLDIPKPYPVPQPFAVKSPEAPHFGFSLPSEFLTAPQYHGNQQSDYQAYLSYGTAGGSDYSSGPTSYGQEHSFSGQGFQLNDQSGYSSQNEHGQGGYSASGQDTYGSSAQGEYAVAEGAGLNHGGTTEGMFESTNSVEDQAPSGHGNSY